MTFCEKLNEYIEKIHCTGKELAESSELSAAVISRYRSGERTPEPDSAALEKLADGVALLALSRGLDEFESEDVLSALRSTLSDRQELRSQLVFNLNTLISSLGVNAGELAKALNYDASYLSRLRSGQRKPSDPDALADGIAKFVVRRHSRAEELSTLNLLTGCASEDSSARFAALKAWLLSERQSTPDSMSGFLRRLDEFDLNEYIRAIKFDELKLPTVPFRLQTSKSYIGLDEMKQGELDFFKTTVLSKSNEPVFMCSDMPMEDMAQDVDFGKSWMFAIAMTLKKGLHLNVIHNIDRPFPELMLGLESWIPIYMTGQVSPYYLRRSPGSSYGHLTYASGAAALTGECIAGHHNRARYYLTSKRDELDFYREKAGFLLSMAKPLMEIFREDSEEALNSILRADTPTEGGRRRILSTPPLETMPKELLLSILRRGACGEKAEKKLLSYAQEQRARLEDILLHDAVHDEVCELTREEFEKFPPDLPFAGAFCRQEFFCTFEEYTEHLRHTREFAAAHPNYEISVSRSHAFRNIYISIHERKWVLISKSKPPAIHFLVRHPRMRDALENFIAPVVD